MSILRAAVLVAGLVSLPVMVLLILRGWIPEDGDAQGGRPLTPGGPWRVAWYSLNDQGVCPARARLADVRPDLEEWERVVDWVYIEEWVGDGWKERACGGFAPPLPDVRDYLKEHA